jgi:ubiquinone/menaquinone biosynthesis C-methylase UbiE
VAADETVADIGCGTGTLTGALLRHLGPGGRVIAVDFSQAMLARARAKIDDPRVMWLCSPADDLVAMDGACDRVVCYSAWPHFADPGTAALEFRRILAPGGAVHILHLISRAQVNHIHSHAANPAIHQDVLPPVAEVAGVFERAGFAVAEARDDDAGYLLTATTPC